MVGAFALARVIVRLRSIQRSIDKLAEIEQARLDLERERLMAEFPLKDLTKTKKVAIATVDVAKLNEKWTRNHPDEA